LVSPAPAPWRSTKIAYCASHKLKTAVAGKIIGLAAGPIAREPISWGGAALCQPQQQRLPRDRGERRKDERRFDGRFGVRHESVALPFRVFDKIQTVAPGAIVGNKRLGAALARLAGAQLQNFRG
jgi:hypothetical protein